MKYKYELSPSLIGYDKYKIKQSGLLKALKNGTWKDYLPTSDENPHDGNKFLDNKYGIFHFHLVKKEDRKSEENPNGKESDEIIIYIKPNNIIYILKIATHNIFRNGEGIKNILEIIEREKPLYVGNNPKYKFHINQEVQSTNMGFINPNYLWNMLGLGEYTNERVLEFESAVLYVLTEDLKNFNIHYAINLTKNIDKEKLECLQKVVKNFDFHYSYHFKARKSLIPDYNIFHLKTKFKNITFKDNLDLYKQVIEMKITDADSFPYYESITKKEAPVLLKSTKTLKDNTDKNIISLMKSPKTNFEF